MKSSLHYKYLKIRKLLLSFILLLVGCESIYNLCCNEHEGPGAVVLTFDDEYINDWYIADSIFSKYEWKVTFCVSAYGTLSEEEKIRIKALQEKGHEIASHSTHHYNASEYLSNHSIEEYLINEIFPSLNEMSDDGLNITSFVYPGGVRSVELDLTLFNYFSVLRGTTYNKLSTKSGSQFLTRGSDELLVYGLGIDNHYEHFSEKYIMELIEYADDENIALILYGHDIADNNTKEYVTSYDIIEKICKYVINNDMQLLTLGELTTYNRID